jgi:predicted transcriptional regulator
MRTLVDIPEEDIKALDDLARRRKEPRAKVIRRAVREHINKSRKPDISEFFGLWKDAPVDGLEFQQRIRTEWDR